MKKLFLFIILFIINPLLNAQVDDRGPCTQAGSNTDLRKLKDKKPGEEIDGRYVLIEGEKPQEGLFWASSYFPQLLPEFPALSKIAPKDPVKRLEWMEDSCRFNAYIVQDYYMRTFWCEGVDGPGIGEVIMAPIVLEKDYFFVIPGYQALNGKFLNYSRPKQIRIHYLIPREMDFTDTGGVVLTRLIYTGSQVVKLGAQSGSHKLAIDNHSELVEIAKSYRASKEKLKHPLFAIAAIEILSVFEGKIYKDHTCIGEIGNRMKDSVYITAPLK
jgi:hypothetical protein